MDFPSITKRNCLPEDGDMPSGSSSVPPDAASAVLDIADLPSQKRAAWGRGQSSSVTTPTTDLVTAPQDNADYWALVAELPYIQSAGQIGRTADPNNPASLKLVPLTELLSEYIGEERGYLFNVRGGAGLDESLTIGNLFNNIFTTRSGAPTKVIIRARNPADSIYLNRVVTLYASNVEVELRSPLVFGASGGLRIMGDQPEVLRSPKTAKAKLRSNAASGANVLHLSSSDPNAMTAANFVNGDLIIIRGQNDAFGKALTKQTVHVLSHDDANNDLYLVEELEQGFNTTYPSSDWPADLTTGTTISLASYAALTVNGAANDTKIRVNRTQLEGTTIAAGSVVMLSTNETEADINFNAHSGSPSTTSTTSLLIGTGSKGFTVVSTSGFSVGQYVRAANDTTHYMGGVITSIIGSVITVNVTNTVGAGTLASWTLVRPYRNAARLEIKRVLSIAVVDASNSDVTFDSPIIDAYATAKFAGITLYSANTNSVIKGAKITYSADQTDRNTHGIQIGYAYKCRVEDGEINGAGGQKGNGVRISNCLECEAVRCRVSNPKFSGSSEGYGLAVYTSDRCSFLDCYGEGCRHNYLSQKANGTFYGFCTSVNELISGFDLHGVRSINTHYLGCRGFGGPGQDSDGDDHKSIFRVGNTSHACGDINTLIEGCTATEARLSGTVATYAALEVFGGSTDVTMSGCFISECQTGVRGGYDNLSNSGENDDALRICVRGNTWKNITVLSDLKSPGSVTGLCSGGIQVFTGALANGATFASVITTTIAPDIAAGGQLISGSYTPYAAPNRRVVVECVLPYMSTDAATCATMTLWADAVCIGAELVRIVTTGANSGTAMRATGEFVPTGGTPVTIQARFGPNAAATLTVNNRFSNHASQQPKLYVREMP